MQQPMTPTTSDSSDRFALWIDRCLARPVEERQAQFEALCEQQPDFAAEARAQLAALQAMGIDAFRAGDPPQLPERLGEYRLIRPLGSGGMGVVYLAEQTSLGREVALKLIRPELLYFANSRERFQREVEAVSRLQHPGIISIHAVGEEDSVPYYAMEHVRGINLHELLKAWSGRNPESLTGADLVELLNERIDGGLEADAESALQGPWTRICAGLVQQMADALEHAHRRGIVHRDVKPGNVVLSSTGRPILLDFGLTSTTGVDRRLTRTGGQVGTLPYMSPEQISGSDPGPATDQYSLGVLLYELLSLRLPFQSTSEQELRQEILLGSTGPLRALNRRVSADLAVVTAKALGSTPGQRYASCRELAQDLERVRAGLPIVARPPSALRRARRLIERHRVGSALLLTGVLLLGGIPTALWIQQRAHNRSMFAKSETIREQSLQLQEKNVELRRALQFSRGQRDSLSEVLDSIGEFLGSTDPLRRDQLPQMADDLLEVARSEFIDALPPGSFAEMNMATVLASASLTRGEYERSEQLYRRVLHVLDAIEQSGESWAYEPTYLLTCRAHAQNGQLQALYKDGRGERIQAARELALEYEGQSGNDPRVPADARASLLDVCGSAHFVGGDHDRARALFERALALARESGDQEIVLTILNNQATLAIEEGDSERAASLLREIQQTAAAQEPPSLLEVAMSSHNLSHVQTRQGELELALENAERALEIASIHFPEDFHTLGSIQYQVGRVLDERGALEAALLAYEKAVDLFSQAPEDHASRLLAEGNYAWSLVRSGEHALGAEILASVNQRLEQHLPQLQHFLLEMLDSQAVALKHLEDPEAEREVRRRIQQLRRP